jgi:hypothetical protein
MTASGPLTLIDFRFAVNVSLLPRPLASSRRGVLLFARTSAHGPGADAAENDPMTFTTQLSTGKVSIIATDWSAAGCV